MALRLNCYLSPPATQRRSLLTRVSGLVPLGSMVPPMKTGWDRIKSPQQSEHSPATSHEGGSGPWPLGWLHISLGPGNTAGPAWRPRRKRGRGQGAGPMSDHRLQALVLQFPQRRRGVACDTGGEASGVLVPDTCRPHQKACVLEELVVVAAAVSQSLGVGVAGLWCRHV